MYSLPSASQIWEPLPRSMNKGLPPPARNARTGEFTPPGMTCCALLKSSSDSDIKTANSRKSRTCDSFTPLTGLQHLRQFQCVVRNQNIRAGTLDSGRGFQDDAFSFDP